MASTRVRNQGKTAFLKEFLLDNPTANPTAANEAWAAAGMPGTVSASLVNKLRAQLNLTGNLRAGRKRKDASMLRRKESTVRRTTGASALAAGTDLPSLDADLDRLIYRVMSVPGMEEVASKLRKARRAMYACYPD